MNNEMKQDYEEAMERLRNCARLDTVAEYVKELEAKVNEITLLLQQQRRAVHYHQARRGELEARIKKLESSDGE